MSVEIRIPALGESVSDAVIARWLKENGDMVNADEPVLEIETDKATMEIAAETTGRLEILKPVGARVQPGVVVARLEAAAPDTGAGAQAPPAGETPIPQDRPGAVRDSAQERAAAPSPEPPPREERPRLVEARARTAPAPGVERAPAPPAEQRHLRLIDGDVERVPMTEIRRTIADRLVEAQRNAAILTTFNEVDVYELMAVRARYRERFKTKHGVDLGLMSLFACATVRALRDFSIVNARIDGADIVYHRHVHLGIAVATPRGLVVPVVREADTMTVAGLERAIGELADRARRAKLLPDELAGGTFSITNGGVFGSLLSTPLLNPPQSGILGMHRIQERPVGIGGQIALRPMMYVALSYDHRLVDGEQAVRFLVRVKEQLEDPARMLLDV